MSMTQEDEAITAKGGTIMLPFAILSRLTSINTIYLAVWDFLCTFVL